jgi:hypothetical protein
LLPLADGDAEARSVATTESEGGVSPRVVPKHQRSLSSEIDNNYVQADAAARMGKCTSASPYTPLCGHSYFRDLLLVAQSNERKRKASTHPTLRGRDQGAADFSDVDLDEAKERLRTTLIKDYSQRDLSVSSANEGLRPSLPGYLATIWGEAARSTGTIAEALGVVPLEQGMVDTASNLPVVSIPRLSGGSGVAVQSAQGAGVQETDPTTTMSSPVSTVAGQVDLSRQLFEFSKPGLDVVIAGDLSRAHAEKLDSEIVNGTASGGRTKGLLSWLGILSVAGTITNPSTFLVSLWQAFSALAGSSGFGASNSEGYVTILHPRRAAWLMAGVSGTLPPGISLVPGQLVVSAGVPSNLGAGTNEDVALIVERSQIVLLSSGPRIAIREDILSATLTIRIQAVRDFALLVKNANAVAKVTHNKPDEAVGFVCRQGPVRRAATRSGQAWANLRRTSSAAFTSGDLVRLPDRLTDVPDNAEEHHENSRTQPRHWMNPLGGCSIPGTAAEPPANSNFSLSGLHRMVDAEADLSSLSAVWSYYGVS